jgi:uncharacterized repeat protein (TIGR03803 family)
METSRGSSPGFVGVCVLVFALWSSFALAQGFKQIHLCGGSDKQPNTLIQNPADGYFYGTSHGGGTGYGSVFKMDTSGNVTTIHSFAGPPGDGSYPSGGLFLNSDGLLYGTTYDGGANDVGTIFKMDTSGGTYSFTSEAGPVCGVDGSSPIASFFKANDGNLYVPMTICGAGADGTVDLVSTSLGETEITYFDHNTSEFSLPEGHMLQGSDNKLYGTASENPQLGPSSRGGIYRVGLGGGTFEVVHNFALGEGINIDVSPPLCLASDGSFYGATLAATDSNGSGLSTGTIFRVGIDGSFQTLHNFSWPSGPDGSTPYAGLVQASDGWMYGSTSTGGKSGAGVIYRIDVNGNYQLLIDLADTNTGSCQPYTELVQGMDGKLYGTTGCAGLGTIYTVDPAETIASVSPNSGPASGGTAVTVAGGGFVAGASVSFAGPVGLNISVPDAMHIDATTQPFGLPGTIGNVVVTQPDTTVIIMYNGWFYDFLDVPTGSLIHDYVRKILQAHITAGCGSGDYCPSDPVTRAQMAVFLLKTEHGSGYQPPACTGIFGDVTCPSVIANWIEELANEHITGGCGNGDYCPNDPVTRAQMAVFLLKTEHGSGYQPPACIGIFGDVTCPSVIANWIEQLYHEGVTGGCIAMPLQYCPSNSVNRGQMAVFLSKTFNLP